MYTIVNYKECWIVMISDINRKISLSVPIFVATHMSESLSKSIRLVQSDKYNESGWIVCRDNLFSSIPNQQKDLFYYNLKSGRIITCNTDFANFLGFAILQENLLEYLKYIDRKQYYHACRINTTNKRRYKLTSSLLMFMYYNYCKKSNIPLDLSISTHMADSMILTLKAKNKDFRVLIDPDKNIVYTDASKDNIELISLGT